MKDHVLGFANFWVDGNDLGDTGSFLSFKTGLKLTYTKWAPNEPNGLHGIEHCVQIVKKKDNEMNDNWCEAPKFFICEFDVKA